MRAVSASILTFVLTFLIAQPASADDEGLRCQTLPGPRPVIVCDPIVIEGRRPVFLFLPRSYDTYEMPPLERDLAQEVLRTVRRAPF